MKQSVLHYSYWICLLLIFATSFTACEDKIDSTAERSNTGETITDYLNSHSDYSDFAYLLTRVGTDVKSVASVSALLNTKGHFTCFAPDNAAVEAYLDSTFETKGYKVEDTPDSIAELIVNNAIIDNGDDDAYLSTLFTTGALAQRSLAGQYIMISFRSDVGGTSIYADTYSRITRSDLSLDNGLIHRVDRVVMPYTSSLPSLIAQTDNLKIFSKLLQMTGWDKQMMQYRDMEYEKVAAEKNSHSSNIISIHHERCPVHRDAGYTAFVEPDSLFCARWGIVLNTTEKGQVKNWNDVISIIEEKCKALYPDATSDDLQSEDNAVNQFVSYHLTGESIPNNCLVIHFNEQGFSYTQPTQYGIDAWTYYTTMGKQRRLLKVTEGKTTEGKRINRYVAKYNMDDYSEMDVPRLGIKISETNGGRVYSALNGFYYTIDDLLYYDTDVPDKVLNERMRYDVSDFFPEQMSSGIRFLQKVINSDLEILPGYYSNAWFDRNNTRLFHYTSSYEYSCFQGDAYGVENFYDITFRLPPVPYKGTYEIRMGVNYHGESSIAQMYIGTNRENLQPYGLPLNFTKKITSTDIGWLPDSVNNDDNMANDKLLRTHGYMKAPLYYGIASKNVPTTTNFRNTSSIYRKILWQGEMEPKQSYYIRFKSVLEGKDMFFFLDYFEIVPKSVYDGPVAEDKW